MTGKATTVFLAAMFASQVALTAVSFADGKKGNGGTSTTTVTSFKAKLTPPPPPTGPVAVDLIGECEGEAGYKKKVTVKTLPAPTTTTQESFSGEVECPVTDVGTAQGVEYDMHLANPTTGEYAICTLVIKEFEFKYLSGNPPQTLAEIEGEYAVKVSQKMVSPAITPTVTVKIGGCTDALGGTTQLVPAVQKDDTAIVVLHGDLTLTPLLTGIFVVGSFDGD